MPIISSVIAKALAFADKFLGFFATSEGNPVYLAGAGVCANLTVLNVTTTPCGDSIAKALAGLSEIGLVAVNYILAGLLAV